MRMPLLEFSIGIANLGQRIDLGDRDLQAAGGHQPSELGQYFRSCGRKVTFRLHAILSRGGEIDDRVDSLRSDAQLQRKFDIPSTECVDEGVDFPLRCGADPVFHSIAIGNGNDAVIGEPLVIRVARQANHLGPSIPRQLHRD